MTCPRYHPHDRACYRKHDCRCGRCRRANTDYALALKAKRDPSKLPPEQHGSESTYNNYNCHCLDCRRAHSEARRERDARENEGIRWAGTKGWVRA